MAYLISSPALGAFSSSERDAAWARFNTGKEALKAAAERVMSSWLRTSAAERSIAESVINTSIPAWERGLTRALNEGNAAHVERIRLAMRDQARAFESYGDGLVNLFAESFVETVGSAPATLAKGAKAAAKQAGQVIQNFAEGAGVKTGQTGLIVAVVGGVVVAAGILYLVRR